jgi:hypothetical protein
LALENLSYIAIATLFAAVALVGHGGLPGWVPAWRPLRPIGVVSYASTSGTTRFLQTLHDHGLAHSGTLSTLELSVVALGLASLAAMVRSC